MVSTIRSSRVRPRERGVVVLSVGALSTRGVRWRSPIPGGNTLHRSYDRAGNMTEALGEADGATPVLATTLEYDSDGRLTRMGQGGEETTYTYYGAGATCYLQDVPNAYVVPP